MIGQRLTQRPLGESHSTRAIRRAIPFAQVVALFLLVAGTSQGQWLEKTIYLPDEFGGLIWPHCAVFDTAHQKAYVGGGYSSLTADSALDSPENWVVVVDMVTLERVGRIRVPDPVSRMCINPVTEKLYCAFYMRNAICVIDCRTDSIVATVALSDLPDSLCVNPDDGKVYCAMDYSVVVIDGIADTVLVELPVPHGAASLCYASANHTIYCYSSDDLDGRLTLIDGRGDSVRAVVELGPDAIAGAVWNPLENKYCCTNSSGSHVSMLFVIAGFGDSLLAQLPLGLQVDGICFNPANNRVYCVGIHDTVYVVDCTADTLIGQFALPAEYYSFQIACSPRSGRLYFLHPPGGTQYRDVLVADCAGDSFLKVLPSGQNPLTMQYDPEHDRFYIVNHLSDDVTVIDCSGDSILGTIGLGMQATIVVSAFNENKVYCGGMSFERIMAIDATTNRVVAEIPTGTTTTDMCYNPALSKLYSVYGGYDTVMVIDCRTDSIVARIGVGDMPMYLAFSPVGGSKVYCSNTNSTYVSVIDCVSDSVIKELHLSSPAGEMLYNTREDKLYCVGGGIFVFDCNADTLLSRHDHFGAPITYNPGENKAYFGMYDTLRVVDCGTDTVVATYALRDTLGTSYPTWQPGCYNTRDHKVYAKVYVFLSGHALVVLDGISDSIIGTHWDPGGGRVMSTPLYNPMNNRVYLPYSGGDLVVVLEGATDSVRAAVAVSANPRGLAWNPVSNRTFVACYYGSCVSVIRDSLVPGVEEGRDTPCAVRRTPSATIVRGTLELTMPSGELAARSELLDASGRRVSALRSGSNDIRGLPAGVYFVRTETTNRTTVARIVATR